MKQPIVWTNDERSLIEYNNKKYDDDINGMYLLY